MQPSNHTEVLPLTPAVILSFIIKLNNPYALVHMLGGGLALTYIYMLSETAVALSIIIIFDSFFLAAMELIMNVPTFAAKKDSR